MSSKNGQKGFILAEFIIALPLLILLLYGLANMTLKIISLAREQMANYVLETEAHEVLRRITDDARAAYSVQRLIHDKNLEEVTFVYDVPKYDGFVVFTDVRGRRRYVVDKGRVISKRDGGFSYDIYTTPVTGGNFFADTWVDKLKFSSRSENVLHVAVEMHDNITRQSVKISTSVFMPGCKEKTGFE